MREKMLTISILVSGREETTIKSLDSLQDLLEQVDSELILVDTGCSKEFRNKISKYTDNIISFEWCNDFAKARNIGLEAAKGKWFLFLDDDEWFEDVNPIIEFFNSGEWEEYEQAVYKARNYGDIEGNYYSDEWVSRMIRIRKDTKFEGRVHEYLAPARGKCKRIEAFVHHFGYVFENEEKKKAHFQRNMSIMEELMEEEPNNMKWKLQAIKEYASIGAYEDVQRIAEDGVRLVEKHDSDFINLCRGAFYVALLEVSAKSGKEQELIAYAKAFLEDKRNPSLVICAITKTVAIELARHPQKESYKEEYVSLVETYFDTYEEYLKEEKSEQQQIIQESIVFVSEAITQEYVTEMSYLLGEIRLEEQKAMPGQLSKLLVEDVKRRVTGNAQFLFLPDRIWNLGAEGLISLEEILLDLSIAQWMAQIEVLKRQPYGVAWQKAEEHLGRICTKEDIRYDYFNFHMINWKITTIFQAQINVEKLDWDSMKKLMEEYVYGNLVYANKVYTEEALLNNMELVPKSIRGAMWIEQALANLGDWSEMLHLLANSAKEWDVLRKLVKRFAVLIGEQQMEATLALNEMEKMAQEILVQVKLWIEQGKDQEAKSTLDQLGKMLPNNQEIVEIRKQLEDCYGE